MSDTYGFYDALLDKLGVDDYKTGFHNVIFEDFDFYDKYAKLHVMNGGTISKKNGILEDEDDKIEKFIYSNNSYKFVIFQVMNKRQISFSIKNIGDGKITDEGETCLLLLIPKNDNYAYLNAISKKDNCSYPDMPKTKRGTILLNVALQLVDDIKSKYNLKYIQLKDNSSFWCQKDKRTTDLSNLYMMTRGDTWYGKRGFLPFNIKTRELDIDGLVNYKLNQKLVDFIKVKYTNLERYMLNASSKHHLSRFNHKLIKKLMEKYGDTSIRLFFRIFISEYDVTCDMFNEIYKKLMEEIGMTDLQGKVYFKPLI